MTAGVLWYVHDHGLGHLQRARAVIPHLDVPVVVAGGPGLPDDTADLIDTAFEALPADFTDDDEPTRAPFHHAPTGRATRARFDTLAAIADRHHCTTVVVDVSAETAVWAHLTGRRVVAVRQSGRRHDAGHRLAWASADAVLVPQRPELEPVPAAERRPGDDWHFTGMFSRYDTQPAPKAERRTVCGHDRRCVVVTGRGGTTFPADDWLRHDPPDGWQITVAGFAGHPAELNRPPGISVTNHVDDLWPVLTTAHLVIAGAGWGSVADAASAGAPLVVVAETRPFDEQRVRARALAANGLALACPRWPRPTDLDRLASRVSTQLGDHAEIADRWSRFHDRAGARRAAALVNAVHHR